MSNPTFRLYNTLTHETEPVEPIEEEASPVSLPLTGVPQFIAAVLVIGIVARARRD